MLIVVDIVVILDIPLVRPVLAFLYFSLVPGLLILDVLKLNSLDNVKRLLVAFGLSIAFLTLVEAFFNAIFLAAGVANPVSTPYVLTSLSIFVAILTVAAFWTNRSDRERIRIPSLRHIISRETNIPLLLFPMLFPFLAIFGTYLMNTRGNNVVLIALLIIIPLYVVVLVAAQRRLNVGRMVYPIALLTISLALLLRESLTTGYLLGSDVHAEYLAYQTVVNNQYWNVAAYNSKITATLSVSLLPAIYQVLTGISGFYMFKLVLQVVFSVTPVVVYVIARKYLNETYAFLAAVLFMAQLGFMVNLQGAVREEIAILFFALACLIYLDDNITYSRKAALFILFASCTVLTHYSTSLVLILVMVLAWIITMLARGYARTHIRKPRASRNQIVTLSMIVIVAAIFYFWWGQIAPSSGVADFAISAVQRFSDIYVLEARGQGISQAVTPGSSIAELIRSYMYSLLAALSVIGVLGIFLKGAAKRYKDGYPFTALASVMLIVIWVVIPRLGTYAITRLFQILLILLAVAIIIGVFTVLKTVRINKQRYFLSAVLVIVLIQFASTSFLIDQAVGLPTSVALNKEGSQYDFFYVSPGDENAAQWLATNKAQNVQVGTDASGSRILLDVGLQDSFDTSYLVGGQNKSYASEFFNIVNSSYVYLHTVNVQGTVRVHDWSGGILHKNYEELTSFSLLYDTKNKIYDNGQSIIYR